MVMVKICGVQTAEAAKWAAQAGADMIGTIFAPSSRQVDIPQAQEIRAALSNETNSTASNVLPKSSFRELSHFIERQREILRRPLLVGVFQDQPLEFICDVVRKVPLDLVQLHGSTETPQMAMQIPVPCIRVAHVGVGDSPKDIAARIVSSDGCAGCLVLLDTRIPGDGPKGGMGKTFDWNIAKAIVHGGELLGSYDISGYQSTDLFPLIMAGGLTPENVGQAVSLVSPWGVDVASGTETNGQKDREKIHAFVSTAKAAAEKRL